MLVVMTCTMLVAAPIMCVGGIVMALREDVGLSWLMGQRAGAGGRHRADHPPDGAAVPADAGRASTRSTGCCASRSRASGWSARSSASRRGRAVRRRQRRPDRHRAAGRAAAGADLPDRDAGVQRVERRGAVVRRARIDSGQIQIGALTAFLSYLMQILMSVMMATFMLMMVPRAAVCAERIAEVLDTETSSVVAGREPGHRGARRGEVELRRRRVPATRAPRRRCCATSASAPRPGRPPRSSAAPAPARRRCCR